ncbi:cyclic-phosphate processing receiver domain-containing protein [uncultured Ruminococcus sp.]|uniref:cyclic-phosphate processing receiver domain-containing protein n=1 Tax=uncultured Ruminococcus sp. TaxID=165186 RepID=UPI000ED4C438|nr:cyclic-phosphate processing receiver domain-containing protein [uncultured Ruminococcus sp.]HCJ40108.1 hypothetical protein [Ruminococcus sp.]
MGLKLFVDDKRDFPERGFECVRSYDDCLMYYRMFGDFDFISLDFDLGDGPTGLDILKWLKENGKSPSHINIHSTHIEGRREMRKFAQENFPNAAVTMNMTE